MRVIESFTDADVARIEKLIRAHTKRATRSKEAAIRSLKQTGILGQDGKLAPQYATPRVRRSLRK